MGNFHWIKMEYNRYLSSILLVEIEKQTIHLSFRNLNEVGGTLYITLRNRIKVPQPTRIAFSCFK